MSLTICRRRLRFACKAQRAIAMRSAPPSRLKPALGRQTRLMQAGSGFLSQHSKDVFFGLGETKGPVRASIRWPSGLVQELKNLPINHRIWVVEGSEPLRMEMFKIGGGKGTSLTAVTQSESETLPESVETWLLEPSRRLISCCLTCRDKSVRSPRSVVSRSYSISGANRLQNSGKIWRVCRTRTNAGQVKG